MPYLLTVSGNRKKKVGELLKKQGIRFIHYPMDGYLIAYDLPRKTLETLPPGVEVLAPISEEEIKAMLQMSSTPIKRIEIKDMVKIISGKFSGFHGIVTRIDDKDVSVGINIFGKVVPVIVGREDIEKETKPDWV